MRSLLVVPLGFDDFVVNGSKFPIVFPKADPASGKRFPNVNLSRSVNAI
ncbi:hypothetical protein [Dyadobacter aurulentus]|nr:hypothetical protein [Dyadobacter sp. UC 10]